MRVLEQVKVRFRHTGCRDVACTNPVPFIAAFDGSPEFVAGIDEHIVAASISVAFQKERCLIESVYDAVGRYVLGCSGALITDAANRWSFWHMGRFAANYHRHSGELPSQTLQFR